MSEAAAIAAFLFAGGCLVANSIEFCLNGAASMFVDKKDYGKECRGAIQAASVPFLNNPAGGRFINMVLGSCFQ